MEGTRFNEQTGGYFFLPYLPNKLMALFSFLLTLFYSGKDPKEEKIMKKRRLGEGNIP